MFELFSIGLLVAIALVIKTWAHDSSSGSSRSSDDDFPETEWPHKSMIEQELDPQSPHYRGPRDD